jgi:basic membrane lipoprotein Med (substrate-binding protein (PBP1-ABC) superfamily)
LRVHVIVAGDADQNWIRTQGAIERVLRETYGAVTTSIRVHTAREKRSALEAAGRHGLECVVCIGAGFERPIQSVASRFPRTAFVMDHGEIIEPNVARVEFLLSGAAYLGGVTAAVMGGAKVGIIDPGSGPPETRDIEAGFEQGFKCRYPWGQVEVAPGVGDIEKFPDAGVRIALWAAGTPNSGLLAVAEAAGVSLVIVGDPGDDVSNGLIIASIVADVPEAIRRIVADVVDDTFVGRIYAFDLGSGVVDLRLGPVVMGNQELGEALDEARDAVNAGLVEIEGMGL